MIDKEKIEEEAIKQLDELGSYGLDEVELGRESLVALYREDDVKKMFKTGISWFLDNLWHSIEERPDCNKFILVELCITDKIKDYTVVKLQDGGFIKDWSSWASACSASRWLYINNLLSPTSEE